MIFSPLSAVFLQTPAPKKLAALHKTVVEVTGKF